MNRLLWICLVVFAGIIFPVSVPAQGFQKSKVESDFVYTEHFVVHWNREKDRRSNEYIASASSKRGLQGAQVSFYLTSDQNELHVSLVGLNDERYMHVFQDFKIIRRGDSFEVGTPTWRTQTNDQYFRCKQRSLGESPEGDCSTDAPGYNEDFFKAWIPYLGELPAEFKRFFAKWIQ